MKLNSNHPNFALLRFAACAAQRRALIVSLMAMIMAGRLLANRVNGEND
jgi:hypothetical protein